MLTILGSGLAGYSLAREVRKRDRAMPITLISRDAGSFYGKPNLSNALASGKSAQALFGTSAMQMASDLGITVLAHTEVMRIDASRRTLVSADRDFAYSTLVIATGADPIRLPLSGDAVQAVQRVNDVDEYARFRTVLDSGDSPKHVTILGAGLIGCEFANDLATAGHRVTVLDPATLPLGRLLPPEAGAVFRDRLAQAGVEWRFGQTLAALDQAKRLRATLNDGMRYETDIVLSAVGLKPRTQLAAAAGFTVARGIVVNAHLQTSDTDSYALGDCMEMDGQVLPFVLPIMQQARTLAKTLTGEMAPLIYPVMPIVVKTPAAPTVIAAPSGSGNWRVVDAHANQFAAEFVRADGSLGGFVLMGDAMRLRASWNAKISLDNA